MKPLSHLLRPLGQAARSFFTHDVALRRDGETVRVVLKERRQEPTARERAALEAARREEALLAMARTELAAVLDELPATRRSLRQLAFVEHALAERGFSALRQVPVDLLRRALEQLEGLVTNWSPQGLATLRSRMAVTLIEREAAMERAGSEGPETADVLPDDPLPVAEAETLLDTQAEEAALAAVYAAVDTAPAPLGPAGPRPGAAPVLDRPIEFHPELPAARR